MWAGGTLPSTPLSEFMEPETNQSLSSIGHNGFTRRQSSESQLALAAAFLPEICLVAQFPRA